MKSKDHHYVVIRERKTNAIEKVMGPMSPGKAERVENGVSMNRNHEKYTVKIVDKKPRTPTNGRGA